MSETTKENKVIIIGAGLTGLVTAFYLKKAGKDFTILEKSERVGGVIRTFREKGFVYEAGPNTAVISQPEVKELFEDLGDACRMEIANEGAKRRLIWKNGAWHALPSGFLEGVKTPLFSFSDKLRLLGEPFRRKGDNPDETLAELVKRRMGKSFLNYAVDPFILGIYAGDPDYLVPKYALPKLYDLEQDYGSFIGGAIKKARQPKSDRDKKATREVFSVEGGLENLIKALAQAVGSDNIILNARDISVNKTNASYEVSCFERDEKMTLITDILVSTTASPEVRDLMPFLDKDIIESITQLEYARVAELSLGFKNWKGMDLNAFGGLVPYRENREILGALFLSSFFKDRAPKDGAMISVFAGGFRKPGILDMNNEALIDVVKSEVMDMLQLNEFKPDILKVFRYEYAIPQYGASSGKRIEAVQKAQQQNPGLFIAGNLRDGIGMADRIKQGREVAEAIIKKVPLLFEQ